MRNVFHQYEQRENKLTHALACALAEDVGLLRRFIRWVTGRNAPAGRIHIVEQQRPGDAVRSESESEGIPDAWIFTDDGWALVIESKVAAAVNSAQLRRHLATASRRGFTEITLLTLTAHDRVPRIKCPVVSRKWTELYVWLLRESAQSPWAVRCASYMEVLESEFIEDGYLTEGAMTSFSGIPFDSESPYNYLEAKRLLRLALIELRKSAKLRRALGMDPEATGRGAITGRSGVAVWDFLKLNASGKGEPFTKYPHLTLAIEVDRAIAIITIPHGIKTEFRRRVVNLGRDGFSALIGAINDKFKKALRGDKGAAPMIIVVQRRYPSQRSAAIVDAKVEFDLRTAFSRREGRSSSQVKVQPQWLDATYHALSHKNSNLQVAIGAAFPYARSSTVGTREFLQRVEATWLACGPLLDAMGIKGAR